jgi:hypothetical protein
MAAVDRGAKADGPIAVRKAELQRV